MQFRPMIASWLLENLSREWSWRSALRRIAGELAAHPEENAHAVVDVARALEHVEPDRRFAIACYQQAGPELDEGRALTLAIEGGWWPTVCEVAMRERTATGSLDAMVWEARALLDTGEHGRADRLLPRVPSDPRLAAVRAELSGGSQAMLGRWTSRGEEAAAAGEQREAAEAYLIAARQARALGHSGWTEYLRQATLAEAGHAGAVSMLLEQCFSDGKRDSRAVLELLRQRLELFEVRGDLAAWCDATRLAAMRLWLGSEATRHRGLARRLIAAVLERAYRERLPEIPGHLAMWAVLDEAATADETRPELLELVVRALDAPLPTADRLWLSALGAEVCAAAGNLDAAAAYGAVALELAPKHALVRALLAGTATPPSAAREGDGQGASSRDAQEEIDAFRNALHALDMEPWQELQIEEMAPLSIEELGLAPPSAPIEPMGADGSPWSHLPAAMTARPPAVRTRPPTDSMAGSESAMSPAAALRSILRSRPATPSSLTGGQAGTAGAAGSLRGAAGVAAGGGAAAVMKPSRSLETAETIDEEALALEDAAEQGRSVLIEGADDVEGEGGDDEQEDASARGPAHHGEPAALAALLQGDASGSKVLSEGAIAAAAMRVRERAAAEEAAEEEAAALLTDAAAVGPATAAQAERKRDESRERRRAESAQRRALDEVWGEEKTETSASSEDRTEMAAEREGSGASARVRAESGWGVGSGSVSGSAALREVGSGSVSAALREVGSGSVSAALREVGSGSVSAALREVGSGSVSAALREVGSGSVSAALLETPSAKVRRVNEQIAPILEAPLFLDESGSPEPARSATAASAPASASSASAPPSPASPSSPRASTSPEIAEVTQQIRTTERMATTQVAPLSSVQAANARMVSSPLITLPAASQQIISMRSSSRPLAMAAGVGASASSSGALSASAPSARSSSSRLPTRAASGPLSPAPSAPPAGAPSGSSPKSKPARSSGGTGIIPSVARHVLGSLRPKPLPPRAQPPQAKPRAQRITLSIDLHIFLPERELSIQSRDVSTTGLFAVTTEQLPVGEVLACELSVPTSGLSEEAHPARIRVVRRSSIGYGCELVEPSATLIAALERLLAPSP